MEKFLVLYNPLAGNGSGYRMAMSLKKLLREDELEFQDFTRILDYPGFFAELDPERKIIVCGGDGTLNRFVNYSDGVKMPNDVYYCAGGSGNDFFSDLSRPKGGCGNAPVNINRYVRDLPYALIKGRKYYFLNGVGVGLDGYCCEVGEKTRGTSPRPINYTKIAITGVLHYYQPKGAVITVNGKSYFYDSVWLCPVMNGRYFGGGMMPTPNQDRLNPEHTVSVMVIHDIHRLQVAALLPQIFFGKHTIHEKNVDILQGHTVHIQLDAPAPVQIDGEVIPGVSEFTVVTAKAEAAARAAEAMKAQDAAKQAGSGSTETEKN